MRKLLLIIILFFGVVSVSVADQYERNWTYTMGQHTVSNTLTHSSSEMCGIVLPDAQSQWPSTVSVQAIWSTYASAWTCKFTDSSNVQTGFYQLTWSYLINSCPAGGTASGDYCINVPACVSPSVRITDYKSSQYGSCSAPAPPPCTAGQTKTLLVLAGTYPTDGTAPTFQLNHDRTAVEQVPTTVNEGGCVYNLPLNPNQNTGCQTSPSGLVYCRVQATQTGASLTGGDTALDASITLATSEAQCNTPLKWDSANNICELPSASPGCYVSALNGEVCPTSSQKNCGKVNGSDVCFTDTGLQSNGYPAAIVDGQVVASKTNENGQVQNCFLNSQGKSICIQPPVSSGCGGFITCLKTEPTTAQPTQKIIPVDAAVKEVTKTSTVTNGDGSKVETKTTTTNIINSSPTITTTNINASGQVTDQTTKKGDSNGDGKTEGAYRAGTVPGAAAAGNWYVATDKTYQSVLQGGLSGIQATPIMSFGTSIFNVTVPTGERPVFTLPSVQVMTYTMPSVTLDPFAAPFMPGVWQLVSSVLKILSVLMAFKIALSGFN